MYIDYFLGEKWYNEKVTTEQFRFRNVANFDLNLTLNVKSLKDFFLV